VPPAIRTFRNTDIESLCRVWNAHYSDFGFTAHVDALRVELCSLAKPYFVERHLLVAEHDGQVVGFLHIGPTANGDLSDIATDAATVSALCVVPCEREKLVASALLVAADSVLRELGSKTCSFKPLLPNCPFYLGLGPADSIIGATALEKRACGWLVAAGYEASIPTNLWELELAKFQAPVDRIQIQIRRSAHVDRQVDEPLLPWWQACVLGHTEPNAFQLTHRTEKRVLNEALFWSVATEIRPLPDSVVWLWPPSLPLDEAAADQLVFLLGEACRQLQNERIDSVRTVSAANDVTINKVLRRIGFVAVQSGVVFEKRY
jgi:hypothetical protein